MTQQEERGLDSKLNWLSWRTLIGFTFTVITITASGYAGVNKIMDAIKDVGYNNKVQDVQLKAIEVRLEKLEVELREMKSRT